MSESTMKIKVYTRQVEKDCYPEGLAYGIHIAYSVDDGEFVPLNKNYGMLFAKGEIREDNTICPKGVKSPRLFADADGTFGIVAERTEEDGSSDKSVPGQLLLWRTKDFIFFEEQVLIEAKGVEEKQPSSVLEVKKEIVDRAIIYFSPICNVGVKVPESIEANCPEEVRKVTVSAVYTDGSASDKKVEWDIGSIDFSKPGVYEISGKVISPKYRFPLAEGYGDPVLFKWDGKWYYISTNDNLDDIGLYVREGDTIDALFAPGVTEHLILPYDEERQLIQTFWAPEFHVIGGELYILFAVSGKKWGPACHLMKLKKGQSITLAESWEDPVPITKMNGDSLSGEGITLDMTFIRAKKASYMVWSYRYGIGTPLDTGSMLYIATIDEQEPWKLTSEPVLLSRPLYGWENVEGTINNEGPYAFVEKDTVYLAYSGGSANSYTYAVGLLTASIEDDLLELSSWKKSPMPVISFYSVEGEYGPGHNSFYRSEDGDIMIAYHAETAIDDHLRCDGIRRVHFRSDGHPDFGLSASEDFAQKFEDVSLKVIVKNK